MNRILIILAILVWPMTAYGALLPQPTGSCPTICKHWETSGKALMGVSAGKPVSCLPNNEVKLVCNMGQCTADKQTAPTEDDLPCNYTLDDILQTAVNFVNFILGIAGSLALLMLAYGGYGLFVSMGNPEGINKAKSTIIGGFIGLILILGAVIFVQFAAVLVGGNVKPSGEVVLEKPGPVEDCSKKADGALCGGGTDNRVCYKKVCVNQCDFAAATEPEFYGFSCQAVTGTFVGEHVSYIEVPKVDEQGKPVKYNDGTQQMEQKEQQLCQKGLCPGNTGFQCCITIERQKEIERLQKEAGAASTNK